MVKINKETVNGTLFILAILAVIASIEWILLKDYEPPESDRPGVLHLR
jgi:hypothetical protein